MIPSVHWVKPWWGHLSFVVAERAPEAHATKYGLVLHNAKDGSTATIKPIHDVLGGKLLIDEFLKDEELPVIQSLLDAKQEGQRKAKERAQMRAIEEDMDCYGWGYCG